MASSQLQLNDPISVVRSQSQGQQKQALEGVVAYLGPVKFGDRSDDWVGVRLTGGSVGLGKNDGSVQGEQYFSCGINSGIFVRKNNVVKRSLTKLEQLRLRRELAVAKARGCMPRSTEQIKRNDVNISSSTDPTISPLSGSQNSFETSEDKGALSTQISDLLSQVTNLQCNLDQVSEKLKTKVDASKSSRSPSPTTDRKPDEIFVRGAEEDLSISIEQGGKVIPDKNNETVFRQDELKESEVKSTTSSHKLESEKVSDSQNQKESIQLPITQPQGDEIDFTPENTKNSENIRNVRDMGIVESRREREIINSEQSSADNNSEHSPDLITEPSTTNHQSCDGKQDNAEEGKEATNYLTAKQSFDEVEQQRIIDEPVDDQNETTSYDHEVKSQAAEFLEKMKVLLHTEKAEVNTVREDSAEEVQMETLEKNSNIDEPGDKYAVDQQTLGTVEKVSQNGSVTDEQRESNKTDEQALEPVKGKKERIPSRFHDKIENTRLQARIDELELYVFKLQSKISDMRERLKKKDQEADFLRQSLSSAVWDAEEQYINRAQGTEVTPPKDKRKLGRLEVISEGEEFDTDLTGKLEAALEIAQEELRAERETRSAEAEQHRIVKSELSALQEERLACGSDEEKVNLEKELANLKLLNKKLEEEKLAAETKLQKELHGRRRSWLKTPKKTVDDSEMNSNDDSNITPQHSEPTETGSSRWSSRWKSKNRN